MYINVYIHIFDLRALLPASVFMENISFEIEVRFVSKLSKIVIVFFLVAEVCLYFIEIKKN